MLSLNSLMIGTMQPKIVEGAETVKEPYEMGSLWIATFADPDGNYFQLMSPWKE